MIKYIEKAQDIIDSFSMYRIVSLTLSFLVLISLVLGFFGVIAVNPYEQFIFLFFIVFLCLAINTIFSKLFDTVPNVESDVITALILFFIFIPDVTVVGLFYTFVVCFIAIASKFLITYRKQHILNPAAVGILAVSFFGFYESTWWIGSPYFFFPLIICGIIVLAKIRKFEMVSWCIGIGFVVYMLESLRLGADLQSSFQIFFLSWPLLFLAFYMLTEPFTTPPTRILQNIYGAFVGGLSSAIIFSPVIVLSPELALIIGNIAFYGFTLKRKLILKLVEVRDLGFDTKEFIFNKPKGMKFTAGQYLEWMLPHSKQDSRGIRRHFTISSSPHEDVLSFSARIGEERSTYKKQLLNMKPGDVIVASQLAGDFVLPKDSRDKLVFVAGGIGITPFLSHMKWLIDRGENRDIILFYCNKNHEHAAYKSFLNEVSSSLNIKVINVLAEEEREGCENGYITKEIIEKHVPDYLERKWYLSGPPGMVYAYADLLKSLKIKNIKEDFFSGL